MVCVQHIEVCISQREGIRYRRFLLPFFPSHVQRLYKFLLAFPGPPYFTDNPFVSLFGPGKEGGEGLSKGGIGRLPSTTIDFCGSLFDEATEESIDDHMSAFSDVRESSERAEPGRSS